MPISRYRKVSTVVNNKEEYEEFLEPRGRKAVMQYRTHKMAEPRPRGSVRHDLHIWKQADRFWKLAQKYYQDSRYWWVIAQYNQKPTEAHISNGDLIVIPLPISRALAALGH
jgi:nucleoid-associated protein YgaU